MKFGENWKFTFWGIFFRGDEKKRENGEGIWYRRKKSEVTLVIYCFTSWCIKSHPKKWCLGRKKVFLPLSIPLRSRVIRHLTTHPWGDGSTTNWSKLSSISSKIPMPVFSSWFSLALSLPPSALDNFPSVPSPVRGNFRFRQDFCAPFITSSPQIQFGGPFYPGKLRSEKMHLT